jgi:hypothetical protein
MKQLNINVTGEFEKDLKVIMEARQVPNKSAALRLAVHETAVRTKQQPRFDLRSLLGIGLKAPLARKKKYLTEDDLWS